MSGAHRLKAHPLPEAPAGNINVTDPDSRNLKTTRGWGAGLQRGHHVAPLPRLRGYWPDVELDHAVGRLQSGSCRAPQHLSVELVPLGGLVE